MDTSAFNYFHFQQLLSTDLVMHNFRPLPLFLERGEQDIKHIINWLFCFLNLKHSYKWNQFTFRWQSQSPMMIFKLLINTLWCVTRLQGELQYLSPIHVWRMQRWTFKESRYLKAWGATPRTAKTSTSRWEMQDPLIQGYWPSLW